MTFESWLLFVGVWFVAGLPLGPNAANCMAVAAAQGLGRAMWAVAGVLLAGCLYMAAVILGLGAVLAVNEVLFTVLKIVGAAYLIWIGVGMVRARAVGVNSSPSPAIGRRATTRNAVLISLSNPKAMISYGAVFSQFISADESLAVQLMIIVPTALAVTGIVYAGYGLLGVGVRSLLGSARRMLWFNRGVGGSYIFAGSALVASELGRTR